MQLWQQERPLLTMVSFQVFLPISLHDLLRATGDGLRSQVLLRATGDGFRSQVS